MSIRIVVLYAAMYLVSAAAVPALADPLPKCPGHTEAEVKTRVAQMEAIVQRVCPYGLKPAAESKNKCEMFDHGDTAIAVGLWTFGYCNPALATLTRASSTSNRR